MFLITIGGLLFELWKKKVKREPECRYKQKAIIDMAEIECLGFVLLKHSLHTSQIWHQVIFICASSFKEAFEGHTLLDWCRNANSSVLFFPFSVSWILQNRGTYSHFMLVTLCKVRWWLCGSIIHQIKANKILFSINIFWFLYVAYRVRCVI